MAKFWPKLLFWLKTKHTFQYPPSSSSIFMMSVLKMSINILHHFYIRPNSECRVGQANHIAILIECSRHFLNPQNDYLMTQIDKKKLFEVGLSNISNLQTGHLEVCGGGVVPNPIQPARPLALFLGLDSRLWRGLDKVSQALTVWSKRNSDLKFDQEIESE